MILKPPGLVKASAYTSAEAAAVFASFSTPPTAQRKRQINLLINTLKSADIWSKLDLFYMAAAADNQAAKINWANPGTNTFVEYSDTITLTPGAVTFTADRGFTGNGTSNGLVASYVPTKYQQNDASIFAVALTAASGTAEQFSVTVGAAQLRGTVRARNTTLSTTRVTSATFCNATISSSVPKMYGGSRVDSSTVATYTNGVVDNAAAATTSTSTATVTKANMCFNGINTAWSDAQMAFGCCGASLSADQAAILWDSVRQHLTSIGAM